MANFLVPPENDLFRLDRDHLAPFEQCPELLGWQKAEDLVSNPDPRRMGRRRLIWGMGRRLDRCSCHNEPEGHPGGMGKIPEAQWAEAAPGWGRRAGFANNEPGPIYAEFGGFGV